MAAKKMRNVLKSKTPASWWGATWREGFFTGNGFIGASVYGGAVNDIILLNSRDLTWQGRTNVVPDVSSKIKEVRRMIEEGNLMNAQNVYPQNLVQKNFRPNPSIALPLCELKIKTNLDRNVRDYSRELDMDTGEVTISFSDGSTRYLRTVFVSRSNNSVVMELKKTGAKALDAEFSLGMVNDFNNRTGNIIVSPPTTNAKYEKFFMYFAGRNDDGFDFGAVAKISHYGGNQTVSEQGIRISGAEKILVVVKLFARSQKEKEWNNLKNNLVADKDTYEKMLKAHSSLHGKLFNSAELEFGGDGKDRDITVEGLLKDAQENLTSSALLEKLWSYGRYLFISGCSEGSRVFMPMGLWNGEYKNTKSSINNLFVLQSCYNHALKGNLTELMVPLLDYYEQRLGDFKDNAMRLFGVRGIFIPMHCAPETGRIGSIKPENLHFTGIAGMVAHLFYEYYLFTQDIKFLKTKALPFIKEAAIFYEEFMSDGDAKFSSNPSCAPLNSINDAEDDDVVVIGKNATIDFLVAKQVFTDLIEIGTVIGTSEEEIGRLKSLINKIPDLSLNEDGAIKAYTDFASQPTQATVSTLYGAYPGKLVDDDTSDEEIKAIHNTAREQLVKKASGQTPQSLSVLSSVFTKLKEKSLAFDCIDSAVKGCVIGNLATLETDWRGMGFTADSLWSSLQLQGNLSITDAIQQTLVSAKNDNISILPVHFYSGENLSYKGMLAEGGYEVDIDYQAKAQTLLVTVKSRRNSVCSVTFPQGVKKIVKMVEGTASSDMHTVTNINLKAGKSAIYSLKYIPTK